MKENKNGIKQYIIWLLEGILVGFGAILPGISGGTLCVAFGMYRPIIEVVSNLKEGLKKYYIQLGIFLGGIAIGFMGLSGLAAWMLEKNTVIITTVFVGFIVGTMPGLWEDAGKEGRNKTDITFLIIGLLFMLACLNLFKTGLGIVVEPGFFGFFLCGICWGLSFIVPGLSSSTLLLFLGLYQPMLEGISILDFTVLIPMGIGVIICVLLLSKLVSCAFEKHYSLMSHCVFGIVIATTIMIMPKQKNVFLSWLIVVGSAAVSYWFTRIQNKKSL